MYLYIPTSCVSRPKDSRAEDQSLTDKEGCLLFTGNFKAGIGFVTAISRCFTELNIYTRALQQFDDESTGKFFMRAVFRLQTDSPSVGGSRKGFDVGAMRRYLMIGW